jgi:hypothetical protein
LQQDVEHLTTAKMLFLLQPGGHTGDMIVTSTNQQMLSDGMTIFTLKLHQVDRNPSA